MLGQPQLMLTANNQELVTCCSRLAWLNENYIHRLSFELKILNGPGVSAVHLTAKLRLFESVSQKLQHDLNKTTEWRS